MKIAHIFYSNLCKIQSPSLVNDLSHYKSCAFGRFSPRPFPIGSRKAGYFRWFSLLGRVKKHRNDEKDRDF